MTALTPAEIAARLTNMQAEELAALMQFNDSLGKPSAIGHEWWNDSKLNYSAMAEAGIVRRYSRPPSGWSSRRYFGIKITPLAAPFLPCWAGAINDRSNPRPRDYESGRMRAISTAV